MQFSEELLELLKNGNRLRSQGYIGRFAPSPSGSLHLGNLRTALLSWLRARLKRGLWLLRVDDLDTPRNRSGAIESLQEDLLWLGLDWDGPVVFQSHRRDVYEQFLIDLKLQGKLYPCRCTRSFLARENRSNAENAIYPGICRELDLSWELDRGRLPSWRLKVSSEFSSTSGDVVLRRSDGYVAYHLATAVDDLTLGISEVVRGRDLIEAMPSQLAVIQALNQTPLSYLYVPIYCDSKGIKLAKREGGKGLGSLQSKGMNAPQVIGFLASSVGLVPNGSELTALELLCDLMKNTKAMDCIFNTP